MEIMRKILFVLLVLTFSALIFNILLNSVSAECIPHGVVGNVSDIPGSYLASDASVTFSLHYQNSSLKCDYTLNDTVETGNSQTPNYYLVDIANLCILDSRCAWIGSDGNEDIVSISASKIGTDGYLYSGYTEIELHEHFGKDKATPLTLSCDNCTDINQTIVTLTLPEPNSNKSNPVNFSCLAVSNLNLTYITLYGNWSGGWHANDTTVPALQTKQFTSQVSLNLTSGYYIWNCQACDAEKCNMSPVNFTFFALGTSNCSENWICNWTDCQDGLQYSSNCRDQNNCSTTVFRPSANKTCGTNCTESWRCGDWSPCQNGQQARECRDIDECASSPTRTERMPCGGPQGSLNLEIEIPQDYKTISPGKQLSVKINITSQQSSQLNTTLFYTIKDQAGNKTFEKNESVLIKTQTTKIESWLKGPKDEGNYTLSVRLSYQGTSIEKTDTFSVLKGAGPKISFNDPLIILLIVVVVLGIIALLIFKVLPKYKEHRWNKLFGKSKEFEIDQDLLPEA